MRRWPRESGLNLRDSIPALSEPSVLRIDSYCWQSKPGKSLDIKEAKISINGEEQVFSEITDTTQEVIFEKWLDIGPTRFQTWFELDTLENLYHLNIETSVKGF